MGRRRRGWEGGPGFPGRGGGRTDEGTKRRNGGASGVGGFCFLQAGFEGGVFGFEVGDAGLEGGDFGAL